MEYINLGNSGLMISRIALGGFAFGTPRWQAWVLGEVESYAILKRAVELGINFFDTADAYSWGVSEEVIGRALRDLARREEVVIGTKFYHPTGDSPNQRGVSRKHIMAAVDLSLRRLGTDYIDLYAFHKLDPPTPMEEMLEAMHDLVKSGKVRYIGASNILAWHMAKLLHTADMRGWTRLISIENHYNLVYREEEREMIPLCQAEGVGVKPFSPLARGFLAGTFDRKGRGATTRGRVDEFTPELYHRESDFHIRDRVIVMAERREVRPAQIALAWLLHKDGVTAPGVGGSKPQHVDDAVGALDIRLSEAELRELEEPYEPHPVTLFLSEYLSAPPLEFREPRPNQPRD